MSTIPSIDLIMNTTVGVEIEITGITRETAARVCAATLGEGCQVRYTARENGYHAWSCFDARGREWKFVSDASIVNVGADDGNGCELNTPPITYAEDNDQLQELIRALRHAGAKTGAKYNCGIHVHVSGKGHTAKSIRNLIHLFYANDELLRKSLGVTSDRERWCKAIGQELVDAAKGADTLEKLADAWYGTYAPYEDRNAHYNSSRYHILNLHRYFSTLGKPSNTVEVRAFNASLHAGEVRSYILLVLSMNASALIQKDIRAVKNPIMKAGNEKFAMRTWLNRMGWTGEMFKNPHALFIKRLQGDTAWKFGKKFNKYLWTDKEAKAKEFIRRHYPETGSYSWDATKGLWKLIPGIDDEIPQL